jgi:hypothetical protein
MGYDNFSGDCPFHFFMGKLLPHYTEFYPRKESSPARVLFLRKLRLLHWSLNEGG